MSKSLVGSSSTRILAGRVKSLASSKRLRSPPESDETRLLRGRGGEKKIFQIAHHMFFLAADVDIIVALAQGVKHGVVFIQRAAELVEIGHFLLAAEADLPKVGCNSPKINFKNVVLPMPLAPIRPILSPR